MTTMSVVMMVMFMVVRSRVMCVVFVVDVRVETVFLVGRVRHLPDATVWLDQTVSTVHHVTMPFLPLVFVVFRVRVFDAVLVRVLGRCLETENTLLRVRKMALSDEDWSLKPNNREESISEPVYYSKIEVSIVS